MDAIQPSEYDAGDLNPKELQKFNDLLLSRDFEKVSACMQPYKKKWLISDNDATLTVKSMKLYEDQIKFGGKSLE